MDEQQQRPLARWPDIRAVGRVYNSVDLKSNGCLVSMTSLHFPRLPRHCGRTAYLRCTHDQAGRPAEKVLPLSCICAASLAIAACVGWTFIYACPVVRSDL
jgi:hypothetical protein